MNTREVKIPGWNHWYNGDFYGYIHEEVFDDKFLQILKNLVISYFNTGDTKTFKTHNTLFRYEGKVNKIISHKQNGREQHVIFDITSEREYRYQTSQTIKSWAKSFILKSISPVFVKTLTELEKLEPFVDNPENWVPYRMHLNVLSYGKCLALHHDTEPTIWTGKIHEVPMRTLTVYLDELSYGGEFYTVNGFVYKPKPNTVLNINGNQVMHGVSANMDPSKKTRYAFSIRFAPITHLYLPGHPDKFLYKTYDSSNNI